MKIYYDNSSEIIRSSRHMRKLASIAGFITITTGVIAFISLIIGYAASLFDVHFISPVITAFWIDCVICAISLCLIIYFADTYPNYHIRNNKLLFVRGESKDTLAILPGDQIIYLKDSRYTCSYYRVEQKVSFTVEYSFRPDREPLAKWQIVVANLANLNLAKKPKSIDYRTRFYLTFNISPQALTDEGRHLLMENFKYNENLNDLMYSWLTQGFNGNDSGDLEITQSYLNNNPYGFREMHIDFIDTVRETNRTIDVI